MYKKLSDAIDYPDWADERWRRLYTLNLWIDGKFYNHLKHSFYDETAGDKYIPIAERRPSVQFNIPKHIATAISRKLFAGRHIPRFVHGEVAEGKADPTLDLVNAVAKQVRLWPLMAEASIWGSVGSVAITFKCLALKEGKEGKLVFEIWKAHECFPEFDIFNELSLLRIAKLAKGSELQRLGYPKPYNRDNVRTEYEANKTYWFIRDFGTNEENTYIPIEEAGWNPCSPDPTFLHIWDDKTVKHKLGFVPGQWFRNLSGGSPPDGDCTWEPAINTCIEGDYTMSQLGRGIRYTAAPQLVVKGQLINWDYSGEGSTVRSPAHMLQFAADKKDMMGNTESGGDAHLLETKGEGLRAGLSYFEMVRKVALEQISMSRKDPDKFRVPQSGKAMEILDEDFNDLVHEQRQNYGEEGLLLLMQKALMAAKKAGMYKKLDETLIAEISLQWPKLFQPSPADLQTLAQAFAILVGTETPIKGTNGPDGKAGATTMAITGVKILDKDSARVYLESIMDIPPKTPQTLPSNFKVQTDDVLDVPHNASPTGEDGGDALDAVNAPQGQTLSGTT